MRTAVKNAGNVHGAKFTAKRVDDVHPWLNEMMPNLYTAYRFDRVHQWLKDMMLKTCFRCGICVVRSLAEMSVTMKRPNECQFSKSVSRAGSVWY